MIGRLPERNERPSLTEEQAPDQAAWVVHTGHSTYQRLDVTLTTTWKNEMDIPFAQAEIAKAQSAAEVAKYTHAVPAEYEASKERERQVSVRWIVVAVVALGLMAAVQVSAAPYIQVIASVLSGVIALTFGVPVVIEKVRKQR